MTTQVMAHGTLATQRARSSFGGFTQVSLIPPATKTFAIFSGRSGSGKSSVLQDIPDSAYINLDLTGTVIPNPRASIWPAPDPITGHPIEQCEKGADGSYFHEQLGCHVRIVKLTHARIKEKIASLIKEAQEGSSFPTCITFDCLDMWIPLIKDYVVERANKSSWEDFAGKSVQTAWAKVYDEEIMATFRDIRQAGIGVIAAIHIVDKFVTHHSSSGEEQKKFTPEVLSITDALRERIRPMAEYVAVVERREDTVEIDTVMKHPVTGEPMMKDGKPITQKSYTKEVNHYLVFTGGLQSAAKGRSITGQLKLPDPRKASCWDVFAEAYRHAADARNTAAPTPQSPGK